MLRELGYTADLVDNGRAALAALERGQYALVLMDCQMPELDGYQATRALRAREKPGEHLPVIAVTAHALVGDRKKALDAGMDDSLSKPISSDGLLAMLERWGTLVGAPMSDAPAATRMPDVASTTTPAAAARLATAPSAHPRATRLEPGRAAQRSGHQAVLEAW